MPSIRRDPSLPTLAWCVAGIAGGFGCLLLAWLGASGELFPVLETPWIASGGLVGLALIGLSSTFLALHLRRRALAQELLLLAQAERAARLLVTRGAR